MTLDSCEHMYIASTVKLLQSRPGPAESVFFACASIQETFSHLFSVCASAEERPSFFFNSYTKFRCAESWHF